MEPKMMTQQKDTKRTLAKFAFCLQCAFQTATQTSCLGCLRYNQGLLIFSTILTWLRAQSSQLDSPCDFRAPIFGQTHICLDDISYLSTVWVVQESVASSVAINWLNYFMIHLKWKKYPIRSLQECSP